MSTPQYDNIKMNRFAGLLKMINGEVHENLIAYVVCSDISGYNVLYLCDKCRWDLGCYKAALFLIYLWTWSKYSDILFTAHAILELSNSPFVPPSSCGRISLST